MQASATAYQYERFPSLPRKAPDTSHKVFVAHTQEPPTLVANQEDREAIELNAAKFYRGLRYINPQPIWPRSKTALALELNDLALEQAEINPLQAFRTLRAALRQDDSVAEIWNNLGLAYLEVGDLETAEHHFKVAIKLDKELATAWGNLGLTYLEAGNYPKAWEHFTHALQLDPTDPLHLNNLGVLRLELEQPESAKLFFEDAIAADQEFHLAYYNLGVATAMLGLHDQSEEHFSQGIRASEKRSCAARGAA